MAWGALVDRRARRDRLDRPGPLAHAGVVLGDHARRAAARRSSTWRAASRTTTRRRGAAVTATTATSCSRRRTSREGVELVQLAFHLADKWRNPVLVYGDYLLAHTQEAVDDRADRRSPTLPAEGLGGRRLARRAAARAAIVTPLGVGKDGQPALGQEGKAQYIATKIPLMEREVRVETGFLDDAETVVVAFGSPAKFVKYAIGQLRAEGHRIGYVRPITLWPFPYDDGRRRGRAAERAPRRQLRAVGRAR